MRILRKIFLMGLLLQQLFPDSPDLGFLLQSLQLLPQNFLNVSVASWPIVDEEITAEYADRTHHYHLVSHQHNAVQPRN